MMRDGTWQVSDERRNVGKGTAGALVVFQSAARSEDGLRKLETAVQPVVAVGRRVALRLQGSYVPQPLESIEAMTTPS